MRDTRRKRFGRRVVPIRPTADIIEVGDEVIVSTGWATVTRVAVSSIGRIVSVRFTDGTAASILVPSTS